MTPQTKHPNHAHARTLVLACFTTAYSISQAAIAVGQTNNTSADSETASLFTKQGSSLRLLAENLNAALELAVEAETAFANCPPEKTYEFGRSAVHENSLLRTVIAEANRALADAWTHEQVAWAWALKQAQIDDLAATLGKP